MIKGVRDSGRIGGTSTITQQLARNFFLTPDRLLKRKLTEIFIALLLEQRFSKQDILKLYANETYMGQRGSFSINGFGEAAAAYFGKDLSSLSLSESATLVAMIPAPNGKYNAMAMQAVLDGVGIAVAQVAYVSDALAAGRLVVPFPILARKQESWFLQYRPVRREDPALLAFRNWLHGEAERQRAVEAEWVNRTAKRKGSRRNLRG